ncbi:MAG: nuclear transport factor 2 family protein [Chitinophagaceae bacterium]|nr:nuclear transport factor 2 family protein [Chitinophagaceae bacterium]
MKKNILVHLVLFISIASSAQKLSPKGMTVLQSIENMFTALANTDTTAFKQSCTGDVKFYEYGQIWTIDTLIQKVMQSKSIPDFKRINSFEFINTTINNKTAWVTYYLQSAITRNGKEEMIKWMETVILIKEKTEWKITVLHSTRLIK